jgi:hypothetical protein
MATPANAFNSTLPFSFDSHTQAWLEESLESLDKSLRDIGSRLILRGGAGHVTPDKPTSEELAGDAASHLVSLVEQSGATHVFYHRAYTPDGSLEQVHLKIPQIRSCNYHGRISSTKR